MEKLPKYLQNAIESTCEQFPVVNYTLHGDKDKLRISIMFSNEDNKQIKRKSNSTINRDNKRMKEYNNGLSPKNSSDIDSAEIIHDVTENVNIVQTAESCQTGMDVDNFVDKDNVDTPFRAFRFKSPESLSVVNKDSNSSHLDRPQTATASESQLRTRDIERKQSKAKLKVNSRSEFKAKTSSKDNSVKQPFTKIVLKQAKGESNIIIGKTFTGKLVLYKMDHRTIEILSGKDSSYWRFLKYLDDDFDDVRSTKLMSDKVKIGIDRMDKYVTDNNVNFNIL